MDSKNIKYAVLVAAFLTASCDSTGSKAPADTVSKTGQSEQTATKNTKTVLFFGDSLTAGYGLDDPSEAFPGLIQDSIKNDNLPYKVINAGVSGETSAGGKSRIDWVLKQKVDVFVLELGANDGLRGIPVKQTTQNLQAIIDRVKATYPDAKLVLAGMQIPPSMGKKYAVDFKAMFPTLAAKNNITLIPFLLDKVGGIASLNQSDGIHPNKAGAKIVAGNVWPVLKTVL